MPTADTHMISRVLLVGTARGTGAGFVIDRKRRQWLVTAGHLVPAGSIIEVDLVLTTGRLGTALRRLPVIDDGDSIAVFELDTPLVKTGSTFEASNGGLLLGQDVHLFGYPLLGYGAWHTDTGGALPFIRKGCMGGTMSRDGTRTLLIDAISEAGMSGGPATFAHERNGKPHIAGVIIDPDADAGARASTGPHGFPSGITLVASIDHVTEAIDGWDGR